MIPARNAPLRGRPPTRHSRVYACISAIILMMVMGGLRQVPVALASGGSYIRWDSSMIYQGQNNNHPWGPVGERALVHGLDLGGGNQQVMLVLVQGDTASNGYSLCQQPGVNLGTVTTDSSGRFDFAFNWPAAAGQVDAVYSVCGIDEPAGVPGTWMFDGPFTVLASNPPVISLSTSSVAAGDSVTVTGQNWVPPQKITVNIAGCADCEPGNTEVGSATVDSTGLNDGAFSVTITIPSATKPGKYVVDALSQNALLDANYTTTNGAKSLTITAPVLAPTPTPSPTAVPTVTPTAVPTATSIPTVTSTPTNSGTGTNTGSSIASNPLLIGLFVAIGLVVIALIGTIFYMVGRRSSRKPRDTRPGFSGQFMQQATPENWRYDPTVLAQQVPPGGSANNPARPTASSFSSSEANGPTWAMPSTPPAGPASNPAQPVKHTPGTFPIPGNAPTGRSTPPLVCTRCGGSLSPDDTFCGNCGLPANLQRADGDTPTFMR